MRRGIAFAGFAAFLAAGCAGTGPGGDATGVRGGRVSAVRTGDGLALSLSADGRLASVGVGGRALPLSGPGAFRVEEVLPPNGAHRDLGPVTGSVSARRGRVRFAGRTARGDVDLAAEFRGGEYMDIRGEVRDRRGRDRALRVTFTLPVKLAGWRWENTLFCARAIEPGVTYPSKPGQMLYLGKKDDDFRNEDHDVYPIPINKLPYSAVMKSGAGLAIAYPLHEPRVFLIRASEKGYSISFLLGVSPATKKFPGRASFRFVVYRVDPAWGLRSAAERYYAFFPELFASRAKRHGNFGFFFIDKLKDRPEDFGFAYMENDFQWKNGEMNKEQAAIAKRLDITVVHWRNPWVQHSPLGSIEGNASPEACLARLKAWAGGAEDSKTKKSHSQDCGALLQEAARCGVNSHLEDEGGRFIRGTHERKYWVFPMNMDPELPRPNRFTIATEWQYRYVKLWSKPGFRGPRGFAWDATDDFDGFRHLNFRREHFQYVDVPLTFDPETGGLCQVKGFGDWEFASPFARKVRAAGGIIMANATIEHSMMFLGPCIDVFVRERKIADNNEERLSVMRMLAGRKPVTFIGHWQPRDETGLRAALHKSMLFGIAPGASGPSKKNKDAEAAERAVFRTRMPVLSAMAAAGWEPVTHARAKGLDVERFGSKPGRLYFAVRNRGAAKRAGRVVIDAKALGLADKLAVREILEGRPVRAVAGEGGLTVEVELNAGETLVLWVENAQTKH